MMANTNGKLYDPYNDWPEIYSFRSRHENGLHFAFADGSVHYITQGIALQTYRALATISGGEAVDASDF